MTILLIAAAALAGIAGTFLGFTATKYVRRAARRLHIMARVLRRAAEWGRAEEALRDRQASGKWNDPYYNVFSEENHRLGLASDVAEQNLLEATREAEEEGLDLHTLSALS